VTLQWVHVPGRRQFDLPLRSERIWTNSYKADHWVKLQKLVRMTAQQQQQQQWQQQQWQSSSDTYSKQQKMVRMTCTAAAAMERCSNTSSKQKSKLYKAGHWVKLPRMVHMARTAAADAVECISNTSSKQQKMCVCLAQQQQEQQQLQWTVAVAHLASRRVNTYMADQGAKPQGMVCVCACICMCAACQQTEVQSLAMAATQALVLPGALRPLLHYIHMPVA
jgi:hypothetical protein